MEQNQFNNFTPKSNKKKFAAYKAKKTNSITINVVDDEELLDDDDLNEAVVVNGAQPSSKVGDDEELLDDPELTAQVVINNNSKTKSKNERTPSSDEELLDDPDISATVTVKNNGIVPIPKQKKKKGGQKGQAKSNTPDDEELLDDPDLTSTVVIGNQFVQDKFAPYKPEEYLLSDDQINAVMDASNPQQAKHPKSKKADNKPQNQANDKFAPFNANQSHQNQPQPQENKYTPFKNQKSEQNQQTTDKFAPFSAQQGQKKDNKYSTYQPQSYQPQNTKYNPNQPQYNKKPSQKYQQPQSARIPSPEPQTKTRYNPIKKPDQRNSRQYGNEEYVPPFLQNNNRQDNYQKKPYHQKDNYQNNSAGIIHMKDLLQNYYDNTSKYVEPTPDYHDFDLPNYTKTTLITDIKVPTIDPNDREYFPPQPIQPRMNLPKQNKIIKKTLDEVLAENEAKQQVSGSALSSDRQINATNIDSIAATLGIKVPSSKQSVSTVPAETFKPKIIISGSGIEITVREKPNPQQQQSNSMSVRGSSLNQGFVKEKSSNDDMSFLTEQPKPSSVVSRDIKFDEDVVVERPVMKGHAVVEKQTANKEIFKQSLVIKQPDESPSIFESDDEENHLEDQKFLNDALGIEDEIGFNVKDEEIKEEEEEHEEEEAVDDGIYVQTEETNPEDIKPIKPTDIVSSKNVEEQTKQQEVKEEIKQEIKEEVKEEVKVGDEEEEIKEEVIIPSRVQSQKSKMSKGGSTNIIIIGAVFVVILAIVAKMFK
ncbi:hypothetical protein TVAG_057340 [Trichomonas vaginalis G3]|uniref:Uncharacterized protein n=1 Tax=Trichomonas vaginalis (strain ATCC PRA-98 / G3) TaxID=412133 RepID=A2F8L2_TRIV3|nr:hypothetical protein TVAGG3_0084610 [Trichomonas vaginalis G3]EAX98744.1 hypothetical protein TVAG_057340 [Trichomonas vaginalis G3]KAI5543506.1 hypothetical protein TVAGG3_0084610 [Trichomonas vaginalis G3]|eukprot:XP_001311674.1 hypothetical protein [Trichomonas vaginalis G3]